MSTPLKRPLPISLTSIVDIPKDLSPLDIAIRLRDGEVLRIVEHYGKGVNILSALQKLLRPPVPTSGYQARLAFQQRFRFVAKRLVVSVNKQQIQLPGFGAIGFFQELYPERDSFLLPFIDVQELYGAWKKYKEGVYFPVLGYHIFPYFGTYAPTRVSHLELFATWLHAYKGAKNYAIDVGTGCGILAFMLSKQRFNKVTATDNNPNSIHSVKNELQRPEKSAYPIDAVCCDLLEETTDNPDLIVFNPPWMKGDPDSLIDGALYFKQGLFSRFFTQAYRRLSPTGRLVILFSNIIQLVQPKVPHPIVNELKKGRFSLMQKMQRKVKPSGKNQRTKEKVELWILVKNP